ncbi:MAG TPA: hypothetical protein ENG59_01930 [Chloroflexi bacterium]|nr:MAG: hypothetical protein DRI46_05040 [Chloroflexota bacterium]HDD54988.1 hypothetical protein [Chloroflexota bacterium]
MKNILMIGLLVTLLAGCLPQPGSSGPSDDDLIGTLVAATLTAAPTGKYLPVQTDQPADATSAPGDSPQPPTATLEPTLTPSLTPTFTLTFTPTATLTPSLVPGDPVLTLGSPTFDDRFNGTTNFYEWDGTSASYQIEQDRMVLIAKKANSYESWSLSWKDIEDFYLEATGTFGDDCSGKDRFGMIFRAPDTTQGYIITISCDGSYRLSKYESEDEKYTVLKGWASSPQSNAGPGSTNRLGIRAQGELLAGYVNGSKVFEITDSTFTAGRMGVVVAASNTPGFTAYLTRVAYWDLP